MTDNVSLSLFLLQYGTQIFLVLIIAYFFHLLLNKLYKKLNERFANNHTVWNEVIFSSIEHPLKIVIWLVAFTIILEILHSFIDVKLFKFIPYVRNIGVVGLVTWVLVRIINCFEDKLLKNSQYNLRLEKSTADLLAKIIKIIVITVATLIAMESLGFSVSGLIAVGGIGGAAVAFAAQNLLSNFFGTLTLYMDKPFTIGEYIGVPEAGLKGNVEEIGWRITKIRNNDKLPVYVPNSIFNRSVIINYTRTSARHLNDKIGIKMQDSAACTLLLTKIKEYINTNKYIDGDKYIGIYLGEFGENFFEIVLDFYLNTSDSNEFNLYREEILLMIHTIVIGAQHMILFTNDNKNLLRA